MTETTNYGLKKPAEGSSGWAEDVNGNFDVIDNKMKANEGIGETLSEHLTPGYGRHNLDEIASQFLDQLGVYQGGLDQLLQEIVGTTDSSEFTKSLKDLKDHLPSSGTNHNAQNISCAYTQWGLSYGNNVYLLFGLIFGRMPYMYDLRYVADNTSVDINESVLKNFANLRSDLSGSVSTGLSIQILKDEGDFYVQENTITTKIYKKFEEYDGITKEHLDKINISGLTVGSTYKIIVWFKRVDASGPEDPI